MSNCNICGVNLTLTGTKHYCNPDRLKQAKPPVVKPQAKASPKKAEVIEVLRTEIDSVADIGKASRTRKQTGVADKNDKIEASRTSKQERQKKYREANKNRLRELDKERKRQKRQSGK